MLICSPCWYEMFLHIYADSFSVKTYMKLTTFIIPTTRRIFTKLSAVSQSSIKIKVRSIWILLAILLTLAVIYKQRLLHGNEIVEYP